jgi:hypothetical protein
MTLKRSIKIRITNKKLVGAAGAIPAGRQGRESSIRHKCSIKQETLLLLELISWYYRKPKIFTINSNISVSTSFHYRGSFDSSLK